MSKLRIPVGSEDHVEGDDDAPCTLVEYGDYECPHCAIAMPMVKRVQKHFGARVRFVFRNFPLAQIHPYAEAAAESAEFAGEHGKFWEMHDQLFENQDQLGSPLFEDLANKLGLSADSLSEALETRQFLPRVRSDFAGGVRSGVNGTPTFFINGERSNGPAEYDFLVAAIAEAISKGK